MVAIKKGRLFPRDIWPDGLWTGEDWNDYREGRREHHLAQGLNAVEAWFKACRDVEDYYKKTMPRFGDRQKIMKRIYPPKPATPRGLTDDEKQYLIELLEVSNHELGQSIYSKLIGGKQL